MTEQNTNWIDEMIERQAIPEELRSETTQDFCKKKKVPISNYYYHASKKENLEKIIKISLNNVKKHAPEVLENLGVRAKKNKADAELYLKFILQLAEKTDITTGGDKINLNEEQIKTIAENITRGNRINDNTSSQEESN